ncbi:MAG: cobalamin adenosyltransferase [Clostridia bacterium]|nr:cobalamin adenosyltransferase [Clostridia bacterium]
MVISEQFLKSLASKQKLQNPYPVNPNDIVTPAAKAYLKRMQIVMGEPQKTEETTHLHAGMVVPKNHPRIVLRGKNDLLQSEIISAQIEFENSGFKSLVDDLDAVMAYLQELMRAEVKDEPLTDKKLLNLSLHEIHEHSHHPSQYYGVRHFLPSRKDGEICARLNRLRTRVRTVEIAALNAFPDGSRKDLITAYNRLSSLFFVMMVKVKGGLYTHATNR